LANATVKSTKISEHWEYNSIFKRTAKNKNKRVHQEYRKQLKEKAGSEKEKRRRL